MLRLVSASANPHKVAELGALLGGVAEVLPRPADLPPVAEDAPTLEGNAELKVAAVVAATGEMALADDTGLEVDALGGAPGVHSARYAGPDADDTANVARLRADLAAAGAMQPAERTARFRTVLVVGQADGTRIVVSGSVSGTIAPRPRGSGGFGYDPVFIPAEGDGRTFAELEAGEKNLISHRARAVDALGRELAQRHP
jgi:XTP/dITP diphosphohydrolase